MNYVHDVLTANDEMSPENNERFKFNDRKEGRGSEITGGARQSDIGEREVASGTECIGLIGAAITHPRVKPTPGYSNVQPLCTISACPTDPSRCSGRCLS